MASGLRKRWLRAALNRSGVAAIEMALLLPIVLLLFFGMIDITALIADARRVSYASNVAADMVTRLNSPADPARVAWAFDGVELVMDSGTTGPVKLEIHTFNGLDGKTRWTREYGTGPDCRNPLDTEVSGLMTQNNDIVVAVVCANHTPIVTNMITRRFMGNADILLQRRVTMRPRQSKDLKLCSGSC
jgi:Flp pilus assembly protein TadG